MSRQKLYLQVYEYYKALIEAGDLKEGEKLPSIRRCCQERGVSKTTVEQAYMCLCDDGYVMSKSQSGYYVLKRPAKEQNTYSAAKSREEKPLIFDFSSTGVDPESFDINLWRRYMKSALRRNEELLSYGEPQGEYELRAAVADYIRRRRNCVCDEGRIVIGAGVQSLLSILCPMLSGEKTVCFDDLSYFQGTAVFSDFGFKISNDREKSRVLYVSPSHFNRWGGTMSAGERFALAEYAVKQGKQIIEDDYGSEFRYINRPTPSLQGLDGGRSVVYLGTFSRLLLPTIRISFMILPQSLMPAYEKRRNLYNQTVSKSSQIALCSYIRDGHLDATIRKSRKLYAQKSRLLTEELKKAFGDRVEILKTDSPLFVRCKIKGVEDSASLVRSARAEGVGLINAGGENGAQIAFSVSPVKSEFFPQAAAKLKSAVEKQ